MLAVGLLTAAVAATAACRPVQLAGGHAGSGSGSGGTPSKGSSSTSTSTPASGQTSSATTGTTSAGGSTGSSTSSGSTATTGSGTTTGPTTTTGSSTTAGGTTSTSSTATAGTTSATTTRTSTVTTSATTSSGTTQPGGTGTLGDLGALAFPLFPASNAWNTTVAGAEVDPASAALIASIGAGTNLHPDFGADIGGGVAFGIPYVVVAGSQKKVPVSFDYAAESDPGPYPIPADAPIEGGPNAGGDRHVLVVDRDNHKLYELYDAHPLAGGAWHAGSGAVFDLNANTLRPAGWTSADAAGLPILPGLVRYDEVAAGHIDHALRFTVSKTRHGYVAPATHFASSNTSTSLPPMGMRVRLKASFDISGYPQQAKVILQALKTYGMIVADNGSNWFISAMASNGLSMAMASVSSSSRYWGGKPTSSRTRVTIVSKLGWRNCTADRFTATGTWVPR